ncbi:MAG: hypothetical protein M3R17_12965 [Bacteroidota bacterium]|nr:hypothetical protein [Bacteroidota bacterium]
MKSIIVTDSFEAFATDSGFLINEKKKSAKKFGLVAMVAGIIFLGISLIDLTGSVPAFIYSMFFYVFRWGSISLIVIGAITFIVKGVLMSNATVIVDKEKREVDLRGKLIPFAEINNITIQTQEVLGKKMTIIILDHQGKKKTFISGSLISDGTQVARIGQFINDVNNLIKS